MDIYSVTFGVYSVTFGLLILHDEAPEVGERALNISLVKSQYYFGLMKVGLYG